MTRPRLEGFAGKETQQKHHKRGSEFWPARIFCTRAQTSTEIAVIRTASDIRLYWFVPAISAKKDILDRYRTENKKKKKEEGKEEEKEKNGLATQCLIRGF